ncbi:MAG: G5 domain-containing protein [Clostridia bacterium]|nr:G5 domain-containing protein [Clostridia bacterium]
MEKLKPETEIKNEKVRFLWLKALFATLKDGIETVFDVKFKEKEKRARKEKQPRAEKRVGKETESKPKAYVYMLKTVDAVLLVALCVSALFCTVSLFVPDLRVDVVLEIDGKKTEYSAKRTTVGKFLYAQGVMPEPNDILSCSKSDELEQGMVISIFRAFPVAVESQNKVTIVKMTDGTVGDALVLAGVEHDTDDELSALPFADVEAGMKIIHTDVEVEYKSSYEELEFNEVTVKDPSMYKGQSKVVVKGSNGEKLITRRITYKDGILFSREIVDRVVLKEAVDQVTNVGSKTRYQTNYVGEWREYKEPPKAGVNGWVEMKVDYITAYSGDPITAMGTVPKLGTIAVTPQYIPYYSQIYVKNYGYGTALDTGAFRNRFENGRRVNQLDLFFNTEKECTRWGRKRNVTILVKLKK